MKSKKVAKRAATKHLSVVSRDEYDDDGNNLSEARRESKLADDIVAEDFRKDFKKVQEGRLTAEQLGRTFFGPNFDNFNARELKATKRLLYKDGHGDFFYDSRQIAMDKTKIYYMVFDALYSYADQDGFLSYEDIESRLNSNGIEEASSDAGRNKRIINAVSVTQGIFRYAKINGRQFSNQLATGGHLIVIVKGKGLQLNNKII